ncbi:MAG: PIG-L family deacetylase [Chitinophagaceae bacterium]
MTVRIFSRICITVILLYSSASRAQTPKALNSADILLGLKKLNVLASVLYIATHPDDENTRLLAYFSKEKLYRTGYMSLTRGDGGQNLIGNEQGIELGLIRTQELLSARRIDGAEQFFSRAYDFGFSKSTEEALKIWDKEKILSDVVWVIRKFHPDVIITRFPQDSRAGHGHHSASAVLAVEAFTAAADPSRFPEQLKWVKPWQAKRILWNVFNFTGAPTGENFTVDVGQFNPLLGEGYGEIAAESRSQHKSQGFGVPRQRGSAIEYFSAWKGDLPKKDLLEGVTVDWTRVKGGQAIKDQIDEIMKTYSAFTPGASVKPLVDLYRSVSKLDPDTWKDKKLKEIQELIEACAGLWVDATTSVHLAVESDILPVNLVLNNRNGNKMVLRHLELSAFDSTLDKSLPPNVNVSFSPMIRVSDTMPVSQPYWLKNPMKAGYFDVRDQEMIGRAEGDAPFNARFKINIEGQDFLISRPVLQKYTDPVKGELYEPVVVVPPVLITPVQNLFISHDNEQKNIHYSVKALKEVSKPVFSVNKIKFWDAMQPAQGKAFLAKGSESDYAITLKPAQAKMPAGTQVLLGSVKGNGENYAQTMRTINYDHIPSINYFKPAAVNLLTLDLQIVGKRIGYIEGAGDYVPAALIQMGYDVVLLNDNNLASFNLGQFDAIVTGVRAYNIKESLNVYYEKLMSYIEEGGNLIVQYNTSNQIGPVKARIGPYPFNISRTRVTDETAEVKVLKKDHPILNYPNKIGPADFAGWVQERSIYHASEWDKHYETVFAMHDTGEPDDEGSLITTKYGKGNFTYTGLVFYRELPGGVPGAYRLMANLIALNSKKPF